MHISSLPSFPWRRRALAAAACLVFVPVAQAQDSRPAARDVQTLEPVVVTGNPLGRRELAVPVSVLAGDELVMRRGSSLGDTLASQPGVSSSYFGPNANRPIVRGLDGDRLRILSNAGASLDASSLSFDHAVPIDPLVVERLEVLRGPGALLYGGSAIGGVVNAIDNRIPKEGMSGATGALELRLGGAERERGGAVLADTGNRDYALHIDAFGRDTADLRVPRFTPVEAGSPLPEATTVRNSSSRTQGGAVGGSLFFDGGHVGVSVDTYDSDYGTPAEPGLRIEMKRDHAGMAFERRMPAGWLRALRATVNGTDYRHQEVEADASIGTVFKSTGTEMRVEAEHAPVGAMRGMVGLQWEDFDFSALGDEAFVPSTRTRRHGVFVLEELPWPGGTLTAGLRIDHAQVHSRGDADPTDARFGPAAERRFWLRSGSLSHLMPLGPRWSVSAALGATERAPTSFELYANGVHAATGVYERGDPMLANERGLNADVAVQWKHDGNHLRLGAFAARFSRFIALQATGAAVDVVEDDGSTASVTEYAFRSVRARLHGVELEGRHRLMNAPWALDLGGKLDYTRATQRDTAEPLPRVAPLRMLLSLDAARGPWGGRIEVDHAARQARVPATETRTPGYTLLNLSLTRRFDAGPGEALWFVKLGNLGNALAYSASTVQTVKGLSPLPGRSLKTGVRLSF